MEEHNHLVIMAGGVGSRFWPMSTPEKPKQFVDVMGCGRSLIQLTFDRFKKLIPAENTWVGTSKFPGTTFCWNLVAAIQLPV